MTKEEAINAVYQGKIIQCSKEEYPDIRNALQDFAGKRIDAGDHMRGIIALEEVKRLDKLYNY